MLPALIALAAFSCAAYLARLDHAIVLVMAMLCAGTLTLTARAQVDSGPSLDQIQDEGTLHVAQPQQEEDAGMLVEVFVKAVRNKWYGLAAAAFLSLLVFALRLLKPDLPPKYTKLAMALMATIPPIVVTLKKPGVTPDDLIATSITSVLMAVGLWKMAFQDAGLGALLDKRMAALASPAVSPAETPAPKP